MTTKTELVAFAEEEVESCTSAIGTSGVTCSSATTAGQEGGEGERKREREEERVRQRETQGKRKEEDREREEDGHIHWLPLLN